MTFHSNIDFNFTQKFSFDGLVEVLPDDVHVVADPENPIRCVGFFVWNMFDFGRVEQVPQRYNAVAWAHFPIRMTDAVMFIIEIETELSGTFKIYFDLDKWKFGLIALMSSPMIHLVSAPKPPLEGLGAGMDADSPACYVHDPTHYMNHIKEAILKRGGFSIEVSEKIRGLLNMCFAIRGLRHVILNNYSPN